MNLYYLPLLLVSGIIIGAVGTILLWVISMLWYLGVRTIKWIFNNLNNPHPVYYDDGKTKIKASFVSQF